MPTDIVQHRSPEEQELARRRQELAILQAELTDRELSLANLRAELAAFEGRYLREVGVLYAELDDWNAKIAEFAADAAGTEQARAAASEARAQAEESHVAANITLAVDTREIPLKQVQEQLGMSEGFDVGLEMSGNASAFRDMIANMSHGGKVAMLGIPSPTEMSIDWHHVIFNQLTLRGVYGREMYETWYKMTVMLQSGLKIDQVITHRYNWKDFEQGFQAMRGGSSGKVILDWSN